VEQSLPSLSHPANMNEKLIFVIQTSAISGANLLMLILIYSLLGCTHFEEGSVCVCTLMLLKHLYQRVDEYG
jgi:hypothetical protein